MFRIININMVAVGRLWRNVFARLRLVSNESRFILFSRMAGRNLLVMASLYLAMSFWIGEWSLATKLTSTLILIAIGYVLTHVVAAPAGPKWLNIGTVLVLFMSVTVLWGAIFYGRITYVTSQISGSAMEPYVEPNDIVVWGSVSNLVRGDVVLYDDPSRSGIAIDSGQVLRILGMPTDDIVLDGSTLMINDRIVVEPYVQSSQDAGYFQISVPVGEYFLSGDNRSKGAVGGLFSKENIKAKVTRVYKTSSLSIIGLREYWAGIIFMIVLIVLPISAYPWLSRNRLLKLLFLFQLTVTLTGINGLFQAATNAPGPTLSVTGTVPDWTMIPLHMYHNLIGWVQYLFVDSPFAAVFLVTMGWIGGGLIVMKVGRKIRS